MPRNVIVENDYDRIDIAQTYNLFIGLKKRGYTTKSKQQNFGCKLQSSPATHEPQADFFSGGDSDDPAEATVELQAYGSAAPAVGTRVSVGISASINGNPVIIDGIYEVQSGDTTMTLVAAGVKATWDCIIDPTNTLPAGGAIRCSDRNASEDDISAAAVAFFGSDEDAAVDATAGLLTFTAGADGADGNLTEIFTEVMPSLPAPLPVFENGVCTNINGLIYLGSAVALNNPLGATTVPVVNDQVFANAANLPGRSAPQFQFQLHELIRDLVKRARLGQTENLVRDGKSNYTLNDGQPLKIKNFAFLAVLRGTFVGDPDYIWSPANNGSFDALNYTVNQLPATQVTITPQQLPGVPVVVKQGELNAPYVF